MGAPDSANSSTQPTQLRLLDPQGVAGLLKVCSSAIKKACSEDQTPKACAKKVLENSKAAKKCEELLACLLPEEDPARARGKSILTCSAKLPLIPTASSAAASMSVTDALPEGGKVSELPEEEQLGRALFLLASSRKLGALQSANLLLVTRVANTLIQMRNGVSAEDLAQQGVLKGLATSGLISALANDFSSFVFSTERQQLLRHLVARHTVTQIGTGFSDDLKSKLKVFLLSDQEADQNANWTAVLAALPKDSKQVRILLSRLNRLAQEYHKELNYRSGAGIIEALAEKLKLSVPNPLAELLDDDSMPEMSDDARAALVLWVGQLSLLASEPSSNVSNLISSAAELVGQYLDLVARFGMDQIPDEDALEDIFEQAVDSVVDSEILKKALLEKMADDIDEVRQALQAFFSAGKSGGEIDSSGKLFKFVQEQTVGHFVSGKVFLKADDLKPLLESFSGDFRVAYTNAFPEASEAIRLALLISEARAQGISGEAESLAWAYLEMHKAEIQVGHREAFGTEIDSERLAATIREVIEYAQLFRPKGTAMGAERVLDFGPINKNGHGLRRKWQQASADKATNLVQYRAMYAVLKWIMQNADQRSLPYINEAEELQPDQVFLLSAKDLLVADMLGPYPAEHDSIFPWMRLGVEVGAALLGGAGVALSFSDNLEGAVNRDVSDPLALGVAALGIGATTCNLLLSDPVFTEDRSQLWTDAACGLGAAALTVGVYYLAGAFGNSEPQENDVVIIVPGGVPGTGGGNGTGALEQGLRAIIPIISASF